MSAFFWAIKECLIKTLGTQLDLPSGKFAPNCTCLSFSASPAQKIFYTVSQSKSVGADNLL
jgi:phosphopantetheinyl transferase (holo-ACP synthase)